MTQSSFNPITGSLVAACVRLVLPLELPEFRKRRKSQCVSLLKPYQIPQRVVLVWGGLHNERFKKMRIIVSAG